MQVIGCSGWVLRALTTAHCQGNKPDNYIHTFCFCPPVQRFWVCSWVGPWLAWALRVLGVLRLWAGVLAGPGRLGSWLVCRRAAGRVHAWGPGPGAVEIWCRGGTGGACLAGRQVAPVFCRWSLLLRSPLCGRGLNDQVGVVFPSVVE